MSSIGIAGLDASGQRAMLGVVTEGRGVPHRAMFGVCGLDRPEKAKVAAAGVNTRNINDATLKASFGVAGIKDSTTLRASYGVAGNLGSTTRAELPDLLEPPRSTDRTRLGDRAAAEGWKHGVYFADYTYVVCTADRGRGEQLRWRSGREPIFGPGRMLPLYLDSTAYRRWTGTAPRWASLDSYLQAIELVQPQGYAAYDVIGDQVQSVRYFNDMAAIGYGPDRGCFPVYHVRPRWSDRLSMVGSGWNGLPEDARCAVANAQRAASDPVMQYYAGKNRLIGLGGMVKGPCPRDVRHYYIAELCRLYPDHQFWALGQANFKVVNGLGRMGLLERVWTDGTWWILDAACERFAVVMDGEIKMLSLEGAAASFFTITECMAANLRSLMSAYAGLWEWPPPDPIPLDQNDPLEARELYERMHAAQLKLFGDDVKLMGNVPVQVN